MSDQLLRAIRSVQRKIKDRREYYSGDEDRTIRSLIDPILNALGWDTDDPDLVKHQYPMDRSIDNKKVDIVLLREDDPIVIVEAKKLGTRLDNHIDQLREYWSRFTTETAILTDGKIWQIYRPYLKRRTFAQRKLFEIDLGEDAGAAKTAARQIEKLTYGEIDGRLELEEWRLSLKETWIKHEKILLDELVKSLHRLFKKHLKTDSVPLEAVRAILHEKLDLELQTASQDLQQTKLQSRRQRTSHQIPQPAPNDTDGAPESLAQPYEVKNNTEALVKVAEWLVESGKLRPKDVPIMRGQKSKYYLIHTQEQHPNWTSYSQKKNLPKGLYIDTHGDPKEMNRLANMLLGNFAPSVKLEDLIRFPT